MRSALLAAGLGLALAAGDPVAPPGEPKTYPLDQAPASLRPALASAQAAADALQKRLFARLSEELARGGPTGAARVCRDEAQALTGETAREQGLRIGRTSHRLRNPRNAAPAWAARLVADASGKKAVDVKALATDLGGGAVGLLRPLPQGALCGQCHGPAAQLSPELRELLAGAYPGDAAVGFVEGDLRGFVWVEVPAASAPPLP